MMDLGICSLSALDLPIEQATSASKSQALVRSHRMSHANSCRRVAVILGNARIDSRIALCFSCKVYPWT
jgi:hypothetical protein